MNCLLKIVDGDFRFDKKIVFNNLSLTLSPGDIYCILGSNGCGKTTLLRCLCGSLCLYNGEVLLENIKIEKHNMSYIAKKIGVVYQEHNVSFPYSVLDVVTMGRSPYIGLFGRPTNKDIKIAEDSLKMIKLYHLKDKPYNRISGGERQLVLIARTLTQETEIILLDEPTSHLDFKNQIAVLKIINLLAERGLAVLMSTHHPNHALLFSNKVSLMADGQFIATGKPKEVINEKNLEVTYGIKVKIVTSENRIKEEQIKLCVPMEENT